MDTDREWDAVLQRSRDTAAEEELRRFANAKVERQRAKEDEDIRLALSASREESRRAEAARLLNAKSKSHMEQRVRAEREQEEALDKAIVESEVTIGREWKRTAGELTRSPLNYNVNTLTEEEQIQLAMLLSQEDEPRTTDPVVPPVTLTMGYVRPGARPSHPATGGTSLSPPARTGLSVRSVSSARSPLSRTEEEHPRRRLRSLEMSRSTPSNSRISEDHSVHSRVYLPSSQADDTSTASATVSTGNTFSTARESRSSQFHAYPERTLSDSWRTEYRQVQQREVQGSRPSTALPLYPPSSGAAPVGHTPLSRLLYGSITRRPVADSEPLIPVTVENLPRVITPDVITPAALASSHLQHPSVPSVHYHYNYNSPVTINNYNVPENATSSISLAQNMLTRGVGSVSRGIKEARTSFKGIAEMQHAAKNLAKGAAHSEIWSRGENRAAILQRIGNRFRAESLSRIADDTASEIGVIDRASVPEVQDDVGSIAPLPQAQQWFVTNPDPSHSNLNTPEGGRFPSSNLPMAQTIDVVTPRMPVLQRLVVPSPPSTVTQQMTIRSPVWTESMISDVNGNAVTPPGDRQSDLTSFLDDGSITHDAAAPIPSDRSLAPQPRNFHKRPPSMLRNSQSLASMPSATASQLQRRSRNPMSRYMDRVQEESGEWLQRPVQFSNRTQGSGPGSPDSMMPEAPTPGRINADLGRRSQFPPVDTNLANVPPGERGIGQFSSRSMADYGRMAHVGNPGIMEVQREQHEQTYHRAPPERLERQDSDAVARAKEKEMQKLLRKSL